MTDHCDHAESLGECWLRTSTAILEQGEDASYDGQAIKEIALMALTVENPDPDDDPLIGARRPRLVAWMHANFFSREEVPS